MTPEKYLEGLQDNFTQCMNIAKIKNHDYAGIVDPFKNFRNVEMLNVSVEKGILVRIIDKISRASNLLERDGLVADEKIGDTLLDLANYAIILKTYIDNKDAGK